MIFCMKRCNYPVKCLEGTQPCTLGKAHVRLKRVATSGLDRCTKD